MKLVEQGIFDLDTPLVEYLGRLYLEGEPLHQQITARMVLSHTTGFPNWRQGGRRSEEPVEVRFEPGTGFGYSGEGFWFLQRTIEHLTGLSTEELTREYLLDPLGMRQSSYVWMDEYESTAAAGHTAEGEIPGRARSIYTEANTAFSIYTTPAEYARFFIEMMRPRGNNGSYLVGASLREAMYERVTRVPNRLPVQRGLAEPVGEVYFGLGWRIDDLSSGDRYLHSGSNRTGFRCFSEFDPRTGNGIVIMTNSASGLHVWEGIMRSVGQP